MRHDLRVNIFFTHPPGNQLLVERLSALERDLLRDSLQVVNEFKKRLSRRFHLEY